MSEQDNIPPSEGSNAEPEKPSAETVSENVSSAAESAASTVGSAAETAAAAVGSATEPPSTAGTALGLGKMQPSEEKTMGMLAHVLGGVTCIVGPLIIWLIKKEESPFVDDQGKEALNFQITIGIGYVVASVIGIIPFGTCISALLFPAIWIVSLIFAIIGGLAANKGEVYRYPFALRFVK